MLAAAVLSACCCFFDRAAMKMANMDSVLDFMFTEPKDENNVSRSSANQGLQDYGLRAATGPRGQLSWPAS